MSQIQKENGEMFSLELMILILSLGFDTQEQHVLITLLH